MTISADSPRILEADDDRLGLATLTMEAEKRALPRCEALLEKMPY